MLQKRDKQGETVQFCTAKMSCWELRKPLSQPFKIVRYHSIQGVSINIMAPDDVTAFIDYFVRNRWKNFSQKPFLDIVQNLV